MINKRNKLYCELTLVQRIGFLVFGGGLKSKLKVLNMRFRRTEPSLWGWGGYNLTKTPKYTKNTQNHSNKGQNILYNTI